MWKGARDTSCGNYPEHWVYNAEGFLRFNRTHHQSNRPWHRSLLTIYPQRAVAKLHRFALPRLRRHHNARSLLNHFIMDTPPFTPHPGRPLKQVSSWESALWEEGVGCRGHKGILWSHRIPHLSAWGHKCFFAVAGIIGCSQLPGLCVYLSIKLCRTLGLLKATHYSREECCLGIWNTPLPKTLGE